MKNTVVQGLAEVPGSFLPSCPHVSTHEAPCRRKGKIKDRELSFLSERGSINGHRTAALLGHVESRPKGARLVQKWRETYIETWLWVGVSCFFFFFHRPAFLSANVYVVHRWDCDAGLLSNVLLIKGKLGGFCVFFTTIGTSIRIFEYILIRFINCWLFNVLVCLSYIG